MTPGEVRSLAVPEYLAFLDYMIKDLREQKRAASRRQKGR